MPYVILADKNGEFDRRELRDAITIGRSLDCQICIRDILLSRHHCRLEPFNNRWVATDMGSKNGTRVGQETITRHILSDGDVLRMGKIQVCFQAGAFVPAPKGSVRKREVRPADPKEDLAGTVAGFQYFDMEEDSRVSGFPIPKPKPADPASYRQGDAHTMVTQMSSSQWDLALSEPDLRIKAAPDTPREVIERQKSIQAVRSGVAVKTAPIETQPVVRSTSPERRSRIPKWMALSFILLAVAVAMAALGIIFRYSWT
ncbi:MAG TPA: FHA domain-containing protein [Tepidisphaeraceae bacterium]|nr:FHA domain-containing protein [Tepidisphaeraceae bacterium]